MVICRGWKLQAKNRAKRGNINMTLWIIFYFFKDLDLMWCLAATVLMSFCSWPNSSHTTNKTASTEIQQSRRAFFIFSCFSDWEEEFIKQTHFTSMQCLEHVAIEQKETWQRFGSVLNNRTINSAVWHSSDEEKKQRTHEWDIFHRWPHFFF